MPIPAKPGTAPAAEEIVQVAGWDGSAPASSTLPDVPETNPAPFLYLAGLGEPYFFRGKAYPRPIQVRLVPGVGGVGARIDDLRVLLGEHQALGRRPIPPNIEVEAFGEKRQGYCKLIRTKRGPHYVSVWERYRMVGARVIWERDLDGWEKFLVTVQGLLGADDVDPAVIDLALAPIREELTALRSAPPHDERARIRREQLERIHPSLAPAPAPDPTPTPKGGRK